MLAYKYVFEGDRRLMTYRDRYYGTAFELPLIAAEKAMGLRDSRSIIMMRHLATFLLFYAGVIFFYLLCKRHFKSWKTGLAGALFLALTPRIFAHSFYNSKDIAFLVFFIISIYSLTKYLDKKTFANASFHALACAILVDVRVTGVFIPLLTVVFFLADLFVPNGRKKKVLATLFVYLALFLFGIILFWPVLWKAPVRDFAEALRQMSRFPWEGTVLYMGEYIKATELPWHYIPVWILITTPVLYIVCFFSGVFAVIRAFLKDPVRAYHDRRNDLIFLSVFFVPVAAVIVLGSVLYDGWRHMFFVYPAFLLTALTGMRSLFGIAGSKLSGITRKAANATIAVTLVACPVSTAYIMWSQHPYQNIYFNVLTGGMKKAGVNFELDYWGLSYREGLEYIAKNDTSGNISVYVTTLPGEIGQISALILEPEDRKRFVFVDEPAQAGYFMSNYRWHKGEYPYNKEFYLKKLGGAKILVIYKLQNGG